MTYEEFARHSVHLPFSGSKHTILFSNYCNIIIQLSVTQGVRAEEYEERNRQKPAVLSCWIMGGRGS